jgi:hypothetical protein
MEIRQLGLTTKNWGGKKVKHKAKGNLKKGKKKDCNFKTPQNKRTIIMIKTKTFKSHLGWFQCCVIIWLF